MLKPIPLKLLKHSATMVVPTGADRWGKETTKSYTLGRVNFQYTNTVRKTKDNTEVVLAALVFVDAKHSTPKGLNFETLKQNADETGKQITLTFHGNVFTLVTVEPLYDDMGALHHYEIGLT